MGRSRPGNRGRPAILVAMLLALMGCGGGGGGSSSAGIRNGTIAGTVLGIVGGIGGLVPLAGVTVTAERQGSPFLIRSTRTDFNGSYVLGDAALGTWVLRFQAPGFSAGALSEVRVFVESGGLAVAPDVVLLETAASGGGNVTLQLVDGATGFPVVGASVTVGGFPPYFADGGDYFFDVPVTVDPGTGLPRSLTILATHPGYSGVAPFPDRVTPIAGASVTLTVSLDPSVALVAGRIQASTLASLYASSGILGTVSITSPQVPGLFLSPVIDPLSGNFTVQVPPSTGFGSVFLDLVFTSPYFQQAIVPNIRAPGPGATASLSSTVVLQPQTASLTGTVVNSVGGAPSGFPSQVVIVETGAATSVVGGSYGFNGVPAGLRLTLTATVLGPLGIESGSVAVTPVPGAFQAPTIVTRP